VNSLESGIYIVATPIGNLSDISQRAIDVLAAVDMIAAEDTRHTKKLLTHLGIKKDMLSLHDHNERQRSQELIDLVRSGKSVALVSDAGTPLISDPGYVFISEARDQGIKVSPIPGPCAVIAALSASGIACASFQFLGFLPAKGKSKRDALGVIEGNSLTHVFYESTHRIMDTLEILVELYPERRIALARELTKTFETYLVGSSVEVLDILERDTNQRKGEFVLIVEGESSREETVFDEAPRNLLKVLSKELPPKKAAAIVAEHYGLNKKDLYQVLVNS